MRMSDAEQTATKLSQQGFASRRRGREEDCERVFVPRVFGRSGRERYVTATARAWRHRDTRADRRPAVATQTNMPPAGGMHSRIYHSATLPSSWRHTGLRQRCPTLAI